MNNYLSICGRLKDFPVIGAPLFIISNPDLVLAQCKNGVVGSFPALNARPEATLDEWLARITEELAAYNEANPDKPAAPFAVNQICHPSNNRLEHDVEMCVKYRVPVVITSLNPPKEVVQAVHSYGGIIMHDIISIRHAQKALEQGVDGLICVAAGAGGHAGMLALRPDPGNPQLLRWTGCPVGGDLLRRRGARGAGHGSRLRLHRHPLHRHRGGAGRPGLQADDRRFSGQGRGLHQPVHRGCR